MKSLPFQKFKKIGWEAQKKLAPEYRGTPLKAIEIEKRNPKKAAVLCLWYLKNNEWHFPLIKRMPYPGVHSGQISFPGGKWEPQDENLKQTAIRETNEEIGTQISLIQELFTLSEIYIPPSNFLVSPYMTYVSNELSFIKEEKEVDEILEISLHDLQHSKILFHQNNHHQIPYFQLHNEMVWGATAMMLSEVKEIICLSL